MEADITATEASRSFSNVLNRVHYRGETFVVRRGTEAICKIVPASPPRRTVRELVSLLRSLPRPDEGYLDAVEQATKRQPKMPKSPWG